MNPSPARVLRKQSEKYRSNKAAAAAGPVPVQAAQRFSDGVSVGLMAGG